MCKAHQYFHSALKLMLTLKRKKKKKHLFSGGVLWKLSSSVRERWIESLYSPSLSLFVRALQNINVARTHGRTLMWEWSFDSPSPALTLSHSLSYLNPASFNLSLTVWTVTNIWLSPYQIPVGIFWVVFFPGEWAGLLQPEPQTRSHSTFSS